MTQAYEVIIKALPVILLILLGVFLRRTQIIKKTTADDLKKIVVNIALPATLFLTFAGTAFQSNYLWIFVCVFAVCILMLSAGIGFKKVLSPDNKYYPALFAGFEAGMMGYALYTSFFGAENTYKFAIIDVGQIIALGTLKELREISDAKDLLTIQLANYNDETISTIRSAMPLIRFDSTTKTLEADCENISNEISITTNLIQKAGGVIERIYTRGTNLESIFLKLTGKELRD